MIDLAKIITRGSEGRDLDYKGPCTWDKKDKAACCGLVKDILALANTGGGYLVIGISESRSGVFVWDGLTTEQATSFESTKLGDFLANYADPPINVTIHKPVVDGKQYVVVDVPVFSDTPHVCVKEFPGVLLKAAVYVRSAKNASEPLGSSADWRTIVEQAVRTRSDRLLESFRAILMHGGLSGEPTAEEQYEAQLEQAKQAWQMAVPEAQRSHGYRIAVMYPARFSAERYDLAQLRTMVQAASVDFRGQPFLLVERNPPAPTHAIDDGLETYNELLGMQNFWQFRRSGFLFAREVLWEDVLVKEHQGEFVGFDSVAEMAAEAVNSLVNLYDGRVDDDEEVVFRFSLAQIAGRFLGSMQGRHLPLRVVNRYHDEHITYRARHSFADWRAGKADHALALCQHVYERFNCETPPLTQAREIIRTMLSRR